MPLTIEFLYFANLNNSRAAASSVISVLQPILRIVARIAFARCAPPEDSTMCFAFVSVSRSTDITRSLIGWATEFPLGVEEVEHGVADAARVDQFHQRVWWLMKPSDSEVECGPMSPQETMARSRFSARS